MKFVTIDEELDRFKDYAIKVFNLSEGTVKQYISRLRIFFDKVKKRPEELEVIDILNFFEWMYDIGSATSTMNVTLSALRTFLDYKVYIKDIDRNVAREFKRRFRTPKKLPEVLTVEEMEKMILYPFKYYKKKKNKELRATWESAVMTVLATTGIRLSEFEKLKPKDVDLDKKQIKVYGKGSKERIVPIITKWFKDVDVLEMYEFLFFEEGRKYKRSRITIWRFITRYGQELFPGRDVTPHTFRHSFATALIREGLDLVTVKEILGHRSIYVTEMYVHIVKQDVIQKLKESGLIE